MLAQGGGISGESFTLKKTGAGDLTLSDSWTISNAMPADGEWHQYTVVKSGSGANNGTLYIDGVKVGSGQLSDAISGTSLRIGRDHRIDNSSDQTNYWDGAISDLRVWNRSLSALRSPRPSMTAQPERLRSQFGGLVRPQRGCQQPSHLELEPGARLRPRSSAAAQGVWDLGVMDITSADVFTAVNGLKSFDQDGTGARQVSSNGELITMYAAGDAYSDWGRVSFLPNTSSSYSDGTATYRPGEVSFTPGSTYPAVAEFTARCRCLRR